MVTTGIFWLALSACSGPQMVDGTVRDIWNVPINDVGIRLGEFSTRTNAQGRFSIQATDGMLTVAKGGYIPDKKPFAFEPEDTIKSQDFKLYPKPKSPGFYAVGLKDYIKIKSQKIVEKETTHKLVRGLRNLGDAFIKDRQPTIIYHAEIRKSEVKQLRLKLHKLDYLDSDQFLHTEGREEIHIGLNVVPENDDGTVGQTIPFLFEEFPIADFYKISFDKPMGRGSYAFHTDNLLTEKTSGANKSLPTELRRAYPFDIKK